MKATEVGEPSMVSTVVVKELKNIMVCRLTQTIQTQSLVTLSFLRLL